MIEITKNGITRKVTNGAWLSSYKKNGWREVGKKTAKVEPATDLTDEDLRLPGEEDNVPALDEIPLSEMNLKQLVAYAGELQIDVPNGTTKRQLREMIHDYLKEGEEDEEEEAEEPDE